MSDAEFLQVIAALVSVFFSVVTAIDAVIVRKLRSLSATNAENATSLPYRRPLFRWRLARFVKSGAIVSTGAGLHYLDHEVHRALQKRRTAVAVPVVLGLLAVVLVLGLLLFK